MRRPRGSNQDTATVRSIDFKTRETTMRLTASFAGILALLCLNAAPAQDEARLLRFPTIHGETVAFTHAGNIYSAPAGSGLARRLTSHDGQEMFPRFSPDGKWLAFTGQYDGNTEVYVMPADGGTPKRLTFTATLARDDVADRMGPNNIVIGWKHDSKTILFRSRMRSHNDFIGQLFTVTLDGGLPEPLPLPRGGFGSYSPDDSKLAYNRIFREFRTWKRYRGGLADDVSVYDFATKKTEVIAPDPASDIIPMWAGDKIYFNSDRDANKRFNLFSYDTTTKETKQVTKFTEFDVKFPSLGDKAIVFENGGFIYKFDLATEKAEKLSIQIRDDFPVARTALRDVSKSVASYEISPDGKRALFSARGDVFTVPATSGPTRNLTNSPGVHDRDPKWSPDGKTIAFISDATGEDEIHLIAQDGSDSATAITRGGDTYKYSLLWSPDGKKIGWSDRKQRLLFIDVATREVTQVAQSKAFEIRDWSWSPDSKWVAYSLPEPQAFGRVWVYSVEQRKSFPVTDAWYQAGNPTFSADGKYLFFVSARDFNPTFGATEFNHVYNNMQRIYLVTLQKDAENPFEPKSDEVNVTPASPAKGDPVNIKIDTDGLAGRTIRLPVATSNYNNLQAAGTSVYYQRGDGFFLFDVAAKKEFGLGVVGGYEISHDQKKMLVSKDGNYGIVDLPRGPFTFQNLNLSGMEVRLDRKAEWKQIYNECWRQMRDFFYDPGMHGVDWPKVRDKYAPLVAQVHHRADLTYVIGEMIGEMNVGHAYVGGGDVPTVPRIPMGLLGAELERDPVTKYYKIARILKHTTWDPATHSPLADLGVNVKEGEFITAVNGVPANEMADIYESLINTAGKQVVLKVNAKPEAKGSRSVTVVPIADESKLYYYDWVQTNIEKVDKASGGKIGYLHVPDMQTPGLNEFAKYYYPQLAKKALIIDMRGNGGGNVSPQLIERLRRELAMVGISRNGSPTTSPGGMFLGPKVCLMNEFSASDGDLFPFQFKYYKLGKLIGKRSWGGVVGIRGSLPLLDGGTLNRPEFSRYDVEGKVWVIEGHGVDPDIVVDNDPAKEYAGNDEQLTRGVEELLKELKEKGEKNLPPVPPYPKR
jgi:tricorn protease